MKDYEAQMRSLNEKLIIAIEESKLPIEVVLSILMITSADLALSTSNPKAVIIAHTNKARAIVAAKTKK